MFIKFGSIDLSGTQMMGLPERQFLPIRFLRRKKYAEWSLDGN